MQDSLNHGLDEEDELLLESDGDGQDGEDSFHKSRSQARSQRTEDFAEAVYVPPAPPAVRIYSTFGP